MQKKASMSTRDGLITEMERPDHKRDRFVNK